MEIESQLPDVSSKLYENDEEVNDEEVATDPVQPNQVPPNPVPPGSKTTIDEIMCEWKGADFKFVNEGMSRVTKIPRKPRSIGCEFKGICDLYTGCIVFGLNQQ